MFDTEREVLQRMVARLVDLAQTHDVPAESIAAAVGEYVEAQDIETTDRLKAAIDRVLKDARSRDGVILSRDQVAHLFRMTPQSVSWHIKQGNLQGVKVRVGGRARVGVPLSSVCDYFDVAPDRRDAIAALLPVDAEGKPERVFWDAAREKGMPMMATVPLGPDGPPPTIELPPDAKFEVVEPRGDGDDSRDVAEVLNTGMIQQVIN